jgi:hypothetical protein
LGKRVNSIRGSEMGAVVVVAESTMVSCTFGREEGETSGFFPNSIVEVVEGVLGAVEDEGNETAK